MNIKTLDLNGINIEYVTKGKGSDLLFLHGGSVSFRTHSPLLNELSKYFRVWAFSFPGAGKSSNLPKNWKFSDYVGITKEFVEKLNIRPVLCGHSLGGAIALQSKMKYPELFMNLFLFAPAGVKQENSSKVVIQVAKNHVRSLIFGPKEQRQDLLVNLLYHPLDLVRISDTFKNLNIENEMKDMTEKVVILWGKDDEVLPVENMEVFKKELRDCEYHVLNGRHEFLTRCRQEVCDIIQKEVNSR